MGAIAMGLTWGVCSALLAAVGMEPWTAKVLGFGCALALGPLVAGATTAADKEA